MTGGELAVAAFGSTVAATAVTALLETANLTPPSDLSAFIASAGMALAGFTVWYFRRLVAKSESSDAQLVQVLQQSINRLEQQLEERDAQIVELRSQVLALGQSPIAPPPPAVREPIERVEIVDGRTVFYRRDSEQ